MEAILSGPGFNVLWHLRKLAPPERAVRAQAVISLAQHCYDRLRCLPGFIGTCSIRGAVLNVFQDEVNTNMMLTGISLGQNERGTIKEVHVRGFDGGLLTVTQFEAISPGQRYSLVMVYDGDQTNLCQTGMLAQVKKDLVKKNYL
ncbi:MAG: hypothetical protein PHH14_04015 [Candidatus Margulisbacteria bacterium]|nr:hypothetical protein [Candidatus Margulisiibacteriota bacterium]